MDKTHQSEDEVDGQDMSERNVFADLADQFGPPGEIISTVLSGVPVLSKEQVTKASSLESNSVCSSQPSVVNGEKSLDSGSIVDSENTETVDLEQKNKNESEELGPVDNVTSNCVPAVVDTVGKDQILENGNIESSAGAVSESNGQFVTSEGESLDERAQSSNLVQAESSNPLESSSDTSGSKDAIEGASTKPDKKQTSSEATQSKEDTELDQGNTELDQDITETDCEITESRKGKTGLESTPQEVTSLSSTPAPSSNSEKNKGSEMPSTTDGQISSEHASDDEESLVLIIDVPDPSTEIQGAEQTSVSTDIPDPSTESNIEGANQTSTSTDTPDPSAESNLEGAEQTSGSTNIPDPSAESNLEDAEQTSASTDTPDPSTESNLEGAEQTRSSTSEAENDSGTQNTETVVEASKTMQDLQPSGSKSLNEKKFETDNTIEILEKLEEYQQVVQNKENKEAKNKEDEVEDKEPMSKAENYSGLPFVTEVISTEPGNGESVQFKKKEADSVEEIENLLEEFVRSSGSSNSVETTENRSIEKVDSLNDDQVKNTNVPKECSNHNTKTQEQNNENERNGIEIVNVNDSSMTSKASCPPGEATAQPQVNASQPMKAKTSTEAAWSKVGMKRCSYCIFTTDEQSLLDAHMSGCGKKYAKRETISLKYKDGRYGCQNCLYAVISRKKFEEHVAFHLRSDPYICLTCMITYESKKGIENHVKQNHGSEEMVKCGLRGSKKINNIVETLHSLGEYSFLGRPLDHKVLMSMVDQKDKLKVPHSQAFSDVSKKLNENSKLSTILSVPKVPISKPIQAPKERRSTSASYASAANEKKSINPTPPIQNQVPLPVQTNSITKTVIANPSPIILIPVTMPTCNVVGSRTVMTPAQLPSTFTFQTPNGQAPQRLVPMTQPRPGQFVSISQSGLVTNVSKPVQGQVSVLSQPTARFILVPETRQVTPISTPATQIAGNIPTHLLNGGATHLVASTLPGDVISTTTGVQERPIDAGRSLLQQINQGPPPPYRGLTTNQGAARPRSEINKGNVVAQNPVTNILKSSYLIKSGTVTPKTVSDTFDPKYTQSILNAEKSQDLGKEGIVATSCVMTQDNTNAGKKLYFRKSGALYSCDHCNVDTVSESAFKEHVWNHFHVIQKICTSCTENTYSTDQICKDVVKVMTGLQGTTSYAGNRKEESDAGNKHEECDASQRKTEISKDQVVFISDDEGDESVPQTNADAEIPTTVYEQSSPEKDKLPEEDSPLTIKIANTYSLSTDPGKSDKDTFSVQSNDVCTEETASSGTEAGRYVVESAASTEEGGSLDLVDAIDKIIDSSYEKNKQHENCISENPTIQSSYLVGDILQEMSGFQATSFDSGTKQLEDVKPALAMASFYQCGFSECGFAARTSSEFRDHLSSVHSGAEFYVCAHCGHKSYTEDCHCRHMHFHTRPQSGCLFKCCDGCRFGTNILTHFREHLEKIHPNLISYKCSSCCQTFALIDELIQHCEANKLRFILCPYCTVKDTNRRRLLQHISSAHPGKPRQITVTSQLVCQDRAMNSYVAPLIVPPVAAAPLEQSVDSTLQEMTIKEEEIGISAAHSFDARQDIDVSLQESDTTPPENNDMNDKSEDILTDGREMGTNDTVDNDETVVKSKLGPNAFIRCSKCSYLATGKVILRKHMASHQRDTERNHTFKCPLCSSGSDSYGRFVKHMNLHEGNNKVKIYMCAHCTYNTNIKHKMTSHGMKNHHSCVTDIDYTVRCLKVRVKAYECNKCEYLTKFEPDFVAHMKKHGESMEQTETVAAETTSGAGFTSEDGDASNIDGLQKRFACNQCEKSFTKCSRLRSHLVVHCEHSDTEICIYRCAYCGFSSTSKQWIASHTNQRHPGKLVRLKRKVETVSLSKLQAQVSDRSEEEGVNDVSIDKHHCDICSFSCSSLEVLTEHTKVHLHNQGNNPTANQEMAKLDVNKKEFLIPSGNVFKEAVSCTECPFKTKLRLDLLRHIKGHPNLYPVSDCSPRREANPQVKSTKVLLKNQFGKRKCGFGDSAIPSKRKLLSDEDTSDEEWCDQPKKRKQVATKSTSLSKPQNVKATNHQSLYNLGGDLLHFKLKPCYTKDAKEPMFECLFCQDVYEDKYSLHKHILLHMGVSFYQCEYCEHGELEMTSLVTHIQREHRKPVQHTQIPISSIESRINKAIHDMKAKEYWGLPETAQGDVMETEVKAEVPDDNPEDSNESVDVKNGFLDKRDLETKSPSIEKTSVRPLKDKMPPCIVFEDSTYKCTLCDFSSPQPVTIKRHAITHSNVRRQVCPYCEYRSNWKSDVHKHISSKHPKRPLLSLYDDTNEEIDSQFMVTSVKPVETLSAYRKLHPQHMEEKVAIKPKVEQKTKLDADKTLNSPTMRVVGFMYVFKCILCKETFKTNNQIYKHLRTSACSRKVWKCSVCKRFKTEKEKVIKDHLKNTHANSLSAKAIVCLKNEKIRKHAIPLRKKIQSPCEDKKLKSKFIAARPSTPQPKFVNRSLMIKKVGDDWMCKKCHYRSRMKTNVARHTRVHFAFKQYGCSGCSFRAKIGQSVVRHMRTCHPGEDLKVKTFLPSSSTDTTGKKEGDSKQLLSKVKVIPIMDKRFKCLQCGMSCYTRSGIYKHVNLKCTKTMIGCSKCEFKHLSKEEAKAHVKNCHTGAETTLLGRSAKILDLLKEGASSSEGTDQKVKSAFPLVLKDGEKPLKAKNIQKTVNQFGSCPECKFPIPSCASFQKHLKGCHKGLNALCTDCNEYVTIYFSRFVQHARVYHNKTKFADLNFVLISKEEIKRRKLDQKPIILYKCTKCDFTSEKRSLNNHYFLHFKYKPYQCEYCNMTSVLKKSIITHTKNAHPNKKLKYRYNRDDKIEEEIMSLIEANRYQLTRRDRRLSSPPSGKGNVEKKKEVDEEDESADEDETEEDSKHGVRMEGDLEHMFSPSYNYTSTYISRLKGTVFRCKICPYQTKVAKTIITHFYMHVPHVFKCPYCDFQNYPRSRISNHIVKEHPGKTIHVVDLRQKMKNLQFRNYGYQPLPHPSKGVCKKIKEKISPTVTVKKEADDIYTSEGSGDEEEKDFSIKADSSGDSKKVVYRCNSCLQSTESLYHYRQHLASHGGFKYQSHGTQIESRLKCGYCSYLAISDADFQKHMEFHFSARPFSCPYCSFSQYRPSGVKNHIKNKHPGQPLNIVKDNTSSCLIGDMYQDRKVMLVDFEARVELEDIFAMDSEEFEKLLNKHKVSVIDLNYIPDEKFNAVSRTLGLGEKFDESNNSEIDEDVLERGKSHVQDNGEDTEMEFEQSDEEEVDALPEFPGISYKQEPNESEDQSCENDVISLEMKQESMDDMDIDNQLMLKAEDESEEDIESVTRMKVENLADDISEEIN